MLRYNETKKENEELYAMVDERDKQITKLKEQLAESEKNYKALKMAKILTIADEDIEQSRKRINKLIRSVNQCITMLSENK